MPKQTRKNNKYKRKILKGGKAGLLYKMTTINDDAQILGSGTFGLVVSDNRIAAKMFYKLDECEKLKKEADIQIKARELLRGIVKVPEIHEVWTFRTWYRGNKYLCGIIMDRVPLVDTFKSAVHILLGYDGYDIDTEWAKDLKNEVSESNPTRGFHASPEMLEAIWEDEDHTDISIESIAHTMGLALATLIKGGIIPNDLEWIYGGDGLIYLIDFGLCDFGTVKDPISFLYQKGSEGLGGDYYIPTKGYRGHEEFVKAYMSVFN